MLLGVASMVEYREEQAGLEAGRIFGGRYHEAAAASRQKTAVSPLRPRAAPSPFVPSRR
jgi:hypothetical protein